MDVGELLARRGRAYFIGIKGTGMCALAEIFLHSGISVSGSDTTEVFYTDTILRELGIPFYEGFDAAHVPPDAALAVYSAAYSAETNCEIAEAAGKGIPLLKYTDALGAYSALFDSSGIAGVHGKTTTAAMAGTLFRAAGLPARVLAGSAVSAFGGRSTLCLGDKYFAAETCEYRRHFLAFHPRRIILTSVESDHQDYFSGYEDIRNAFVEYALRLPPRLFAGLPAGSGNTDGNSGVSDGASGGSLIYCTDDPGACETVELVRQKRNDIHFVPYGFTAPGEFRIADCEVRNERMYFRLAGSPGEGRNRGGDPDGQTFTLRIPGKHSVQNAAAALALTALLAREEYGSGGWNAERRQNAAAALEDFAGSRRRSEIIGDCGNVLFMDDYGHHPTAVRSTLEGLKEFYPSRRLIVSFMSHTYTRTAALLSDFAASLLPADVVFLHKIYPSARETYQGGINGLTLFEKTRGCFDKEKNAPEQVYYIEEPEDAAETLAGMLREGDLFITMGAGDNWKLGKKLLALREQSFPQSRPDRGFEADSCPEAS